MATEQGSADAQSSLGVMHADGRGVPKDAGPRHVWFSIPGATGSEIARGWRDTTEDHMTANRIERTTEPSRACMDPNHGNRDGRNPWASAC